MNYKTSEFLIALNIKGINDVYKKAAKICWLLGNSISVDNVESAINTREKMGDTYVGNNTIVLHIVDDNISSNFATYCYLVNQINWKSIYSLNNYRVKRIVFMGLNPKNNKVSLNHLSRFCENPQFFNDTLKMHDLNKLIRI